MPISLHLTLLLGALQTRFRATAVALDAVFVRVGRQLEKRRSEARALESASRAYPVVTFMDDAVEAWLDRSQHHAFSPTVKKTFGQELAEGGRGFVRGIKRIPESIQAARAIPAVLSSFAGLLETMGKFLDTSRRGMTVRERMLKIAEMSGRSPKDPGFFDALLDFAPKLPRVAAAAVVVLDSLARFVRTLGSNDGAALRTLAGGAESMAARMGPVIAELFPPSQEPPAPPSRLEDTLRTVVEGMGVALLALPGLILYLGPLLTKLAFGLRLRIVEAFAKIEAEYGWGLRKTLLELFFVDLEQLRRDGVEWLRGGGELVLSYLSFGLSFAELYLAELLDGIRLVAHKTGEALGTVTEVITWIGRILTAAFDLNLLAAFLPAPLGMTLTLANLLEAAIEKGAEALSQAEEALALAEKVAPKMYQPTIRALRRFLSLPLRTVAIPNEPRTPRIGRFPPLFAELLGKGKGSLLATFRDTRDLTKSLVSDVLLAGQALLVDAEKGFDKLREDAASQDVSGRFLDLVDTAKKQTADLLLIEHFWQATHDEPTGFERVSRAFEQTLLHGGFYVVGFALKGFIKELDSFWRAEKQAEADAPVIAGKAAPPPTSPHQLARRARLGTVEVPRLTIRARGRALDADLRTQVAERVRRAVAEIYQTGRAQVATAQVATVPAAG